MHQTSPEPLSRTICGPPAGVRVEELAQAPTLGSLYLKGGGRAVTAKVPGTSKPPRSLPEVAYRTRGVRADAELLAGYEDLLHEPAGNALPAGFVHVLAFPVATALMVRPDFPVPLLGVVHLANTVSVLRPIPLDAELEVTAWTQDLRPHRRGAQFEVVAEVRVVNAGANGVGMAEDVSWRGVSTYLAKGAFIAGGLDDDGGESASSGTRETSEETTPTPHILWSLSADVGREYGAISGDRNPIHMTALSAKAFGFPRAIAHGMYTAARALADVGARRGETFDWTVEFGKPVLLPGRVALTVQTVQDPGDVQGPVSEFHYEGRHPRTGRTHFTGTVRPR